MIADMHNATDPKPASFISAMKHFFGLKEGQTISQFSAELKALNTADREYFAAGLRQNGYDVRVVPPND